MPRLSADFQQALRADSAGGPALTNDELEGVIRRSSEDALRVFAAQAIDAVESPELLRIIAARIGVEGVPEPVNSLAGDPAARAWLLGSFQPARGRSGARNRAAIQYLQRALIKIGVHHAQGVDHPALLQLPYGADGVLGQVTMTALNQAVQLAGRPDLTRLGLDPPLRRAVALAVELLLDETPLLLHPVSLRAPVSGDSHQVLFIGMGDASEHEAANARRMVPAGVDVAFIGDSKAGDDVIRVAIGRRKVTFNLTDSDQRTAFVAQAFTPALGQSAQECLLEALEPPGWGFQDSLDEVAHAALRMYAAETSLGAIKIEQLSISGHSAGSGIWGDTNGLLSMTSLEALCAAFPSAAAQVKSVSILACNHLHPTNVVALQRLFPNLLRAFGYSNSAPGTWVGAIPHYLVWQELQADPSVPEITPSVMMARLEAQQQQARARGDQRDPFYLATRKAHHIATWDRASSQYRFWEEDETGDWIPHAKAMPVAGVRGPDPALAERRRRVEDLEPEFDELLAGVHPEVELREVDPQTGFPRDFYNACTRLTGTLGLTDEALLWARSLQERALCACYYGRVLEKFANRYNSLIIGGNFELSGVGLEGKNGAQLTARTLLRKGMLDYCAEVRAKVAQLERSGRPANNARQLSTVLDTLIVGFQNIPITWL